MAKGKLRIYLGAAPGVGKTFAMLDEGWRGYSRGKDVVVGIVVTHGRPKTLAQVRDLEVIPERQIDYRGTTFMEMDVDAILARKPQVALVDELAHTNVPGSRNEKRWQDVDELLNAGIDVISTVNIQHLESLNDVVNQITGIVQRETVPDAVVRGADQIELVDMSPEALRRRMAHGNIYAPEKVDAALGNYFRVGNLAALRELALLWVADRVEDSLQSYMTAHGIKTTWETRERVVVALTGAPGGEALIRRASRMAARSKGDLLGVHVRNDDGLTRPPSELLAKHKALLLELGGTYHEVAGNHIPAAMVNFAKAEHATQLVLGTSRRSRWTELTRGSIINNVVRLAAPMDVHVIHTEHAAQAHRQLTVPKVRMLSAQARARLAAGFLAALVLLPAVTALLVANRSSVSAGEGLLVYLGVVVAVAAIGGIVPALATLIVAAVLDDWFLVHPWGSLTVERGAELVYLASFLLVGAAISVLVELAARRRDEVSRAQYEADALLALADRLTVTLPAQAVVDELRERFDRQAVTLLGRGPAGWEVEAAAGEPVVRTPEMVLGDQAERIDLASGHVIVLTGPPVAAADRRLLSAFIAHLDAVVQMRDLQGKADTATQLAQANDLRTAILAAVSHDLRTPLASIKASATSLLECDVDWSPDQTGEFLHTIDTEADRLNALVDNLLDMSRLQTGALQLNIRPVGLDEVVPAALASLSRLSCELAVDVPESLPRVEADPALLERAIANIVDNAVAHSQDCDPVRIEAGEVAGRVDLRVVDRGRGIPMSERDKVFQPFQRLGDRNNATGVGLGLAVAKGFVEAMGGELTMEDTPGGGITMVISLRAVGADPLRRVTISDVLAGEDGGGSRRDLMTGATGATSPKPPTGAVPAGAALPAGTAGDAAPGRPAGAALPAGTASDAAPGSRGTSAAQPVARPGGTGGEPVTSGS
ncbi:MAG: ATP-binding protein [Acidimicrobiales bacterium]